MTLSKITVLLGGLVLLSASLSGQSLGDVARQQRQKQNDKPAGASHKVITDEDIPAHSDDSRDAATTANSTDTNSDTPINTEGNAEELKRSAWPSNRKSRIFKPNSITFAAQASL